MLLCCQSVQGSFILGILFKKNGGKGLAAKCEYQPPPQPDHSTGIRPLQVHEPNNQGPRGPPKFVKSGPFRPADIQARPCPTFLWSADDKLFFCYASVCGRVSLVSVADTAAPYHINIGDTRFGDGRAINF